MNEKSKYLIVLVVAVLVSAATSYATTLSLNSTLTQSSQNFTQNETHNRVNLNVTNVSYDISAIDGLVEVPIERPLSNITIVYRYTCLNGSIFVENIKYGTVNPAWTVGITINPDSTPEFNFRIPENIVVASSSTKTEVVTDSLGRTDTITVWDVYPQIQVSEVFGYT